MKKILLSLLFSLFHFISFAQAGEWTWMKGSTNVGALGVFGTQGVANPANVPPAIYGAGSWTDKEKKFWLFGGSMGTNDINSSLWMFDPSTNYWTWIKGPSTPNSGGNYGTQGIADPNNYPGARAFGFLTWADTSGNLWLYGGSGFADLWRYEIATNEWTWMHGYQTQYISPVYGTQGVPAATNHPGTRAETTCSWTDSQNRLWFFGGYDDAFNYRDDMWMYDIATNEWTWMGGSNQPNVNPQWGIQGNFSSTNTPGGRLAYCSWIDDDDHLWLFGGGWPDWYSDLWKYDITINKWAWMSGANYVNSTGNNGEKCNSLNYYPQSRSENRGAWRDCCGNFWLYGGGDPNGLPTLNDLWIYMPSQNQWSWVSGDSTYDPSPVYGLLGVSSPTNKPGGRIGVSSWLDDQGNLWFFGGAYLDWSNPYNDLWRYTPDPLCHGCNIPCSSASALSLSSSDTTLCQKFCIDFFDQSSNNSTAWQWILPGGNPSFSTDQNPANICYPTPGIYDVTLITTNSNGSDTLTLPDFITVFPTPGIPTISQTGYTLTSSAASNYQWQFNNIDIPGATNQSYDVTQTGYYTVVIKDENGCASSTTLYVLITGIAEIFSEENVVIYPNPSDGSFIVEWLNGLMVDHLSIQIFNTLGEVVFSSEEKVSDSHYLKTIDASELISGIYFLELKTKSASVRKKLIVVE